MQNGSQERRETLLATHNAIVAERVAALVPDEQRAQMLTNGRRATQGEDIDPIPVVRLFAPDGRQSWLLTEIDPVDGDTAYGLCDLGIGMPECGTVSLAWLSEQTGPASMRIERDKSFPRAGTPALSHYDRTASAAGRIII